MKALVLSGEAGTRLWPLTHASAERLVPVAPKALRFHGLASIADARLTHVGVTVGVASAHIREAVDTEPRHEVRHPCIGPFTSVAENRLIVDSEAGSSLVPRGAPSEGMARVESGSKVQIPS
ncbi:sugar phosphate nucleotidyltransferase [Streptomyces sp. NBC_00285]|uniref:sugar phosphate nucleotidyltransferase n=1 Tax=Streptomyces sp. NBC_00285 TaxID=2975700 RepID=UPI002E2C8995|nr:sugar phosphate nucleotidyltransferase [Streptomyces sp. NBC_00285]